MHSSDIAVHELRPSDIDVIAAIAAIHRDDHGENWSHDDQAHSTWLIANVFFRQAMV